MIYTDATIKRTARIQTYVTPHWLPSSNH